MILTFVLLWPFAFKNQTDCYTKLDSNGDTHRDVIFMARLGLNTNQTIWLRFVHFTLSLYIYYSFNADPFSTPAPVKVQYLELDPDLEQAHGWHPFWILILPEADFQNFFSQFLSVLLKNLQTSKWTDLHLHLKSLLPGEKWPLEPKPWKPGTSLGTWTVSPLFFNRSSLIPGLP